jgi:UTP--glucose-1-phosphate uridylyltransferase
MLPIGRRPVLEHVLLELRAAGISQVLFVVSPAKEMIRNYFGDGSQWGMCCDYALQPEMRGLGDAILHAEEWTSGEDFVVAFGDALIRPSDGAASSRMVKTYLENQADVSVLVQLVPPEKTHRYGIIDPLVSETNNGAPFAMRNIVEKPKPEDAPGRYAVAARYCLANQVFKHLRDCQTRATGELGLTEAVCSLLQAGGTGWAVPLQTDEERQDIGGWDTYLTAAAIEAIHDPEFGAAIRSAIDAEVCA